MEQMDVIKRDEMEGVAYIDRIVYEVETDGGGESDEEESDVEEPETDDDLFYDTDWSNSDDEYINVKDSSTVTPRTTDPSDENRAPPKMMWRLDKDESFSDWTIEVTVEDGDADSQHIYHVHRSSLAVGQKKSGYFEALFKSDQFNESSSSTSKLTLPGDAAECFPDFLDFIYSHQTECKGFICYENCLSLDYLADYFGVPELSDAITEFIKEDMNDITHLERYLRYYYDNEGCRFDFVKSHAATICAENILSIKVDSSLLALLPPAMMQEVIFLLQYTMRFGSDRNIKALASKDQAHICSLAIAYIRKYHNQLDGRYFDVLAPKICLLLPGDLGDAFTVVTELLELVKLTGWELAGGKELVKILSDYLKSVDSPSDIIASMVKRIPDDITSELLTTFVEASKTRKPRRQR